ncbi:molybdopterin-dependent oxidoreductase [Mycolicibacterium sp. 3033]|nr:molybdopterin-dependent oxidoreductase [Mycolicibacterium aurantiacum]
MHNRLAACVAGLIALLVVAACGGDPGSGSSPSSPASSAGSATQAGPSTTNPYGAPAIDPAGPDEPILKVEGGSTPLALTMDQLNALGDTTLTIDEPFVKKRQTFRGVPLDTVLSKAGIPDTATIETVALNDYRYAGAVAPMIGSQALIATERDGAPIPYDQGGPIRIVFPDGTPLSTVLDAWNWSLASIAVTDRPTPGT